MKKYLMTGMAAVALCGAFTSCSRESDFGAQTPQQSIQETYETAFKTRFGEPAATQTWGFGESVASTRGITRSQAAPSCPNITLPYDSDWVTEYLKTAKEPNQTNAWDNYDNSYYTEGTEGYWEETAGGMTISPTLPGFGFTVDPSWNSFYGKDDDLAFWNNTIVPLKTAYDAIQVVWDENNLKEYVENANKKIDAFYDIVNALGESRKSWLNVWTQPVYGVYTEGGKTWVEGTEGYWTYDVNFVRNFKITGTWNGDINVVATEGLTDGVENGNQRTVVVTGTWNLTADQRVGSLGRIIVANGGKLVVAAGKQLQMVNQAQLVVLPGGEISGDGFIEVSNGNEAGRENYNGGTINIGKFNNNFGKFYNNGTFKANEYQGGAQESNFYNHSLVVIDHFGPADSSTANARIFNACQFYVKNNARIRNYEGVQGSALIVGGELMFSSSEDGTTTPTYVGLAAGALVQCGTLYNNGTSWSGPTSGEAVLDIEDKITFLNWQQDAPQTGGYFENNIDIYAKTWDNVPGGNGWQAGETSTAEYKMFNIVANCTAGGTGNVQKVEKGNYEVIPADEDFEKGVKGCTPGFKIKKDDDPKPNTRTETESLRVIAEDLSVGESTDFDFNDVVFDVIWTKNYTDETLTSQSVKVVLQAAGGTLPLYVAGHEVHGEFGEDTNVMINTKAAEQGYRGNDNAGTREISLTTDDWSGSNIYDIANSIDIYVIKNETECHLSAPVGGIASKIGVKTNYDWCKERQDIEDKYSLEDGTSPFREWVNGIYPANDWYGYAKNEIVKYRAAKAALNGE